MVFSWFSSSSDSEPKPETERGGYECAPYTILEAKPEYEVRSYPERKWATVVYEKLGDRMGNNDMGAVLGGSGQPQSTSFRKLFRYISGANEPGSKISMTVPVSTRVTNTVTDQGNVIKEEMGFYVPTEHQDTTPAPKAETDVNIVTRPVMVAFVRGFGGYAKDEDWIQQRDLLINDLKSRDDFHQIDTETYFRQGFDAPFKFWGRKNEVFVIKKST